MRSYAAIFVCLVGHAASAHAGEQWLASSDLEITFPSPSEAEQSLVGAAIDPARQNHAFSDAAFRITSRNPAADPLAWAEKPGGLLGDLEDSFGRPGGTPASPSNQLGADASSFGFHPNGSSMQSTNESFTKLTVIPLPSAGLLGAAGLALVGLSPVRRRR